MSALKIQACYMPHQLSQDEAGELRGLMRRHCPNGVPSHACSGRISIDRGGMTLNCPLCGDARGNYPTPREPSLATVNQKS